jgi:hypothetical protein
MAVISFQHSGRQGDLLYSQYFCLQRSKGQPYDFHLHINVPDEHDPGGRKTFMSAKDAEFIASILREQPYIRNLTIGPDDCVPASDVTTYINLDLFRGTQPRYGNEEIREWYYRTSSLKPDGFDKKILTIPESNIPKHNKIVICFTARYKSAVSPTVLQKFADRLVYVGLPREYDMFCSKYFKVDYHPVQTLKDVLQYTEKGCGFIGNISGQYAAMELAKLPRILCLPVGGGDVRPYGPNGVAVMDSKKLIKSVEALFDRNTMAK